MIDLTDARPDSRYVLPYILAELGERRADDVFAEFEDGTVWTYADAADRARRVGHGLRATGVARSDKVLLLFPNGPLAYSAWFGINMLGAVFVGINTAYKGAILRYVIDNSDASVIICHPEMANALLDCGPFEKLKTVFTDLEPLTNVEAFGEMGLALRPIAELEACPAPDLPVAGLRPWDLQSICYTSGTTGPSKGVLSSYRHLWTMSVECTEGTGPDDRWVINQPIFHVGGTLFVVGALARGSSVAILRQFRTDTFLDVCRELRGTAACLLGAMATFLLRKPESSTDRSHGIRRMLIVPLSEGASQLHERFGFDVYTVYNMSELSCPIRSPDNPPRHGTCGQLRPGVEARLVDENDIEVPPGVAGELMLRMDEPWTLALGYHKMPEATARAWRNGWFHTGDLLRRDEAGYYYFVDRNKDAIRRRGENVSSFEVEAEILAHLGILEAAAVGVSSEFEEQEILAAVVFKPGRDVPNVELLEFLAKRLPYFMVPRYIRCVASLPKTQTGKVEKHRLRGEGVTDDTWDREKFGIRMTRPQLR